MTTLNCKNEPIFLKIGKYRYKSDNILHSFLQHACPALTPPTSLPLPCEPTLRNILELICNEPVGFNLRLDHGLLRKCPRVAYRTR